MKKYDPSQPLIFIHIPKTAGTSVSEVFQSWFGDGFVRHYPSGANKIEKFDLDAMAATERSHVVYGHFNHKRGFGVLDCCPNATQFMTVMRNPWDQRLSGYFYSKSLPPNKRHPSLYQMPPLHEFLLNTEFSQLDFFPRKIRKDNYKEIIDNLFVGIGTTEKLHSSLDAFAHVLNRDREGFKLNTLNTSQKDQVVPDDLLQEFRHVHSLECEIYDYIFRLDPKSPTNAANTSPPAGMMQIDR